MVGSSGRGEGCSGGGGRVAVLVGWIDLRFLVEGLFSFQGSLGMCVCMRFWRIRGCGGAG